MKKKMLVLTMTVLSLCMMLSACSNSTTKTDKNNASESGSIEKSKNCLQAGILEQNSVEMDARKHWTASRESHAAVRKNVKYNRYSSLNTMLMELSAGRVDYLQLPISVANYLLAKDDKLKSLTLEDFAQTQYHMAVRAEDTALYEDINKSIDSLKADGTLDKLVADYITGNKGEPVVNKLEKQNGAKTYVVAVTGDLPPMDYVSTDGKAAGFNVALLNAIAEKTGDNFQIVQLDAPARLSALSSGKVDMIFWIGCFDNKDYEPEVDGFKLCTSYFEEGISWVSHSSDILDKVKSIYSSKKKTTLTMDEAAKANTLTHLLQSYKSVTYAQLDCIGGDTMHMIYSKDKDGNCYGVEDDFDYTGYRTDGMDFSREKGKSAYQISATKDFNVSNYMFVVPGGTFTSQTTDEKGNLVCEAEAPIGKDYADQLSKSWSVTTKDKMVTTTVFAADDKRVLSIDFSIRRTDGSELKIASGVLLYNKEVSYTDAVKNYLDSKKYAVTVKMVDGSVRTAQIPEGEQFTWNCDDGYALYTDKEGKSPLSKKSNPVKNDLILYCLAKK